MLRKKDNYSWNQYIIGDNSFGKCKENNQNIVKAYESSNVRGEATRYLIKASEYLKSY